MTFLMSVTTRPIVPATSSVIAPITAPVSAAVGAHSKSG